MDEILSHAINTHLLNIGMVKGKDEVSMMTVHSVLHKHLHGNLEDTLELIFLESLDIANLAPFSNNELRS